jgi:hypothetical protein
VRNDVLGKTIITDRYRVVHWQTGTDSTVLVEVYDHLNDPDENINIAADQPALTDSLLLLLKKAEIDIGIGTNRDQYSDTFLNN